jgi:hypothetical protein
MLKKLLYRFKAYFYGKEILWTSYVRIFCDAGQPKTTYWPTFRRMHFAKFWNMKGFCLYWLGREFSFCFGKDINNLYWETNAKYNIKRLS